MRCASGFSCLRFFVQMRYVIVSLLLYAFAISVSDSIEGMVPFYIVIIFPGIQCN